MSLMLREDLRGGRALPLKKSNKRPGYCTGAALYCSNIQIIVSGTMYVYMP